MLFGTPHYIYRDDEIRDGEETGRCKSELLKGCYCRSRNPSTPEYAGFGSVCVGPDPPVLCLIQKQSTTPTEPPPTSSEFRNVLGEGHEDLLGHTIPQKDVRSEVSLRKAPELWLDSYILGSKLGFDTDGMPLKESLWEVSYIRPWRVRHPRRFCV